MAIIPCPECGRNVSDQAQTCPDCAFPIASVSAGGASSEAGAPVPAAVSPAVQHRVATPAPDLNAIGAWQLLAALMAAGSIVLWWVAVHWQEIGGAVGGMAAALVGTAIDYQVRNIAKRAAVVEPEAGSFKTGRAIKAAIREHAPAAGFVGLLLAIGLLGNMFWAIGYASRT